MSKYSVDYDRIYSMVNPRLEHSANYVKDAYRRLSTVSIPSTYRDRGNLIKIINELNNLENKISNVEKYIISMRKSLEFIEDESLANINHIEKLTVKQRNKIIKNI